MNKEHNDEYFFNVGMKIFYELAKKSEAFGLNEKAFSEFVSRLAQQHSAIIEKYEETDQLNEIYALELAKFYNIVTAIPIEELKNEFVKLIDKVDVPEIKKAILYPAFKHQTDKKTDQTAHIPLMCAYVLGDNTLIKIDSDKEELSEFHEVGALVNEIMSISNGIAKHWAGELTLDEQELISENIYFALFIENRAATKEDVSIKSDFI